MAASGTPRQEASALAQKARHRSARASTASRSRRAPAATSIGGPTRTRTRMPAKWRKSAAKLAARQVPSIATGTTRAVGAERRSASTPPALNFPRRPSRLRVPSAKITPLARSRSRRAPSRSISASCAASPFLREMNA